MTTTTIQATETTQYPLSDAITDLEVALESAIDDDDVSESTCQELQAALLTARAALAASDEPRLWELADDSGSTETVLVSSLAEAEAEAEKWVRGGDWDTSDGTCYIDIRLACAESGEAGDITVTIGPDAPLCGGTHEWTSPEWLGGCRENPGVWGHGGGVRIIEVCAHCGCARHTDTWAQRPDTGEQGLESVSYTPGYAEEYGPADIEQTE